MKPMFKKGELYVSLPLISCFSVSPPPSVIWNPLELEHKDSEEERRQESAYVTNSVSRHHTWELCKPHALM